MQQQQPPFFAFLDRYMSVPETKVRYLTKVTLIDRLLAATLLKLVPWYVTPNQITRFRMVCVPLVAFFFLSDMYLVGSVLFVLAALSDALDGALARTTRNVTTWGIFYDPIADKLLIGTVSAIVITKFLSPLLALAIVFLEIMLVLSAYFRYKGKIVPAKTMGKTKMILQCVGVILLLLYVIFGGAHLLFAATYTLYAAIFFALLSLTIFRSV